MKVKCRRSKHDDDDGNDDDDNVLATALMALIRLIVADIGNTAQCLNTVYEHPIMRLHYAKCLWLSWILSTNYYL